MTGVQTCALPISKADEEEKENPFEKKAEDEKDEIKPEVKASDDDDKEETNKAILEALKSIVARQDKMEKAMETPTDLPQSPKGNADSEDIGDKVTAPKDPYPTGDQSGIQDANGKVEDKPEGDKGDLKMQEKSISSHVTSPVERPTTNVSKAQNAQEDLLPYQILSKCRNAGFENLSMVGKSLLDIAEKYDKEGTL